MVKPQEIEPNGYYANLLSRRLIVRQGWDNTIAEALVERSLEPEIVERYARDNRKRFTNLEKANTWFANNQPLTMYTLALARTAELAGVIWIAPPEEKIPEAERAFNMRMYETVRGRGLAIDFGMVALFDYERQNPDYEGDLGVNVNRDYRDEIRVLEALDFHKREKHRTNEFITMVRPGLRSRFAGVK